MKKNISVFLTFVLIISCLSISTYADTVDTNAPDPIAPQYTYLANCWAGLNSTGNGWYNVTGGAGSMHGELSISVTMILQRFNLNSATGWDDLYTWTDYNTYSASCGSSYYLATPGTYRTHVIAKIYLEDGTLGETETVNSQHVKIQ